MKRHKEELWVAAGIEDCSDNHVTASTGETIKIAALTTVGFKPSKDLKRFMTEK